MLKDKAPRTVWAVLIGVAQFINCFAGIRRAPNAKVIFNAAKGFNEGALEIRISTRNGAGVAKGSPILVDYGPGFSMEEAARLVGGSHKNFRGALDATFASQREALPEEAAMNAEQAAMEDADLATAAEAERKRKAEADAREEEAAKRAKTEAA